MNPVGSFDHLRRARASYEAHRYDLSVASSLDAIAEDPNDATAHVILSLSYDRLNRLPEADAAARRAIELAPENARAYIALGVVRLSQSRYPEALRAFSESSALDAEDDDAFRLAAIAQMNQQHYVDALILIGRALAIAPDVIASREVRAMTLRLMGRHAEAEAETATVLRLHPESVLGLTQEGFLTLSRGDAGRARAAFREALRLDPNSASVRAGYERVVLTSSVYASWCGRPLAVAGMFFFFSYSAALRISNELGVASIVTALVIWTINRPLANEALRRDEIGRTFVALGTKLQDRCVILAAVLAEAAAVVAASLHQAAAFWATFGFLVAAVAAGRTANARLGRLIRNVYAGFGIVFPAACVLGATLTWMRGGFETLPDAHDTTSTAASVMLIGTVAGFLAFVVFDAVAMFAQYAEMLARRLTAISARFARR